MVIRRKLVNVIPQLINIRQHLRKLCRCGGSDGDDDGFGEGHHEWDVCYVGEERAGGVAVGVYGCLGGCVECYLGSEDRRARWRRRACG